MKRARRTVSRDMRTSAVVNESPTASLPPPDSGASVGQKSEARPPVFIEATHGN